MIRCRTNIFGRIITKGMLHSSKRVMSQSVGAALTKYHRLGGLQTTNLFLTALKAEIRVLAWLSFGVGLLLGCRLPSSCCVLGWWKKKTLFSSASYSGINPIS